MIIYPVMREVVSMVMRDVDNVTGPHPPNGYEWLTDKDGNYVYDQYGEHIAVLEA